MLARVRAPGSERCCSTSSSCTPQCSPPGQVPIDPCPTAHPQYHAYCRQFSEKKTLYYPHKNRLLLPPPFSLPNTRAHSPFLSNIRAPPPCTPASSNKSLSSPCKLFISLCVCALLGEGGAQGQAATSPPSSCSPVGTNIMTSSAGGGRTQGPQQPLVSWCWWFPLWKPVARASTQFWPSCRQIQLCTHMELG